MVPSAIATLCQETGEGKQDQRDHEHGNGDQSGRALREVPTRDDGRNRVAYQMEFEAPSLEGSQCLLDRLHHLDFGFALVVAGLDDDHPHRSVCGDECAHPEGIVERANR